MDHASYMERCLELATRGAGRVAPNPMVGALLVYQGRIIGEGWHQEYGKAHAEVNCLASVKEEDRELISQSVMYVSLEPCTHYGKTPPCADLIIRNGIPRVVIGSPDPNPRVKGGGMEVLAKAGIAVEKGVLEQECRELNKRFFTFHSLRRPYVILKWAQTSDGFIGHAYRNAPQPRMYISNAYTNRLVHQWRSEEASLLVGTNTAMADDPQLTNRLWPGPSPMRLVLDMELKLPATLKLFDDDGVPVVVFNALKHVEEGRIRYYQLTPQKSIVRQLLDALYQWNIQSVMVEGGARMLQSFISEGEWDEARVICNTKMEAKSGVPAPVLRDEMRTGQMQFENDKIEFFKNRARGSDPYP